LVYSQIWLNLPKDHRQFFNIFLWMVARKENSLKTRWWRGCDVLKEKLEPVSDGHGYKNMLAV
jgi:hypothetical protein